MASALERELERTRAAAGGGVALAAPSPGSTGQPTFYDILQIGKAPSTLTKGGTRPTVLYEPRQAGNIGVETLLDRAENGKALFFRRDDTSMLVLAWPFLSLFPPPPPPPLRATRDTDLALVAPRSQDSWSS